VLRAWTRANVRTNIVYEDRNACFRGRLKNAPENSILIVTYVRVRTGMTRVKRVRDDLPKLIDASGAVCQRGGLIMLSSPKSTDRFPKYHIPGGYNDVYCFRRRVHAYTVIFVNEPAWFAQPGETTSRFDCICITRKSFPSRSSYAHYVTAHGGRVRSLFNAILTITSSLRSTAELFNVRGRSVLFCSPNVLRTQNESSERNPPAAVAAVYV